MMMTTMQRLLIAAVLAVAVVIPGCAAPSRGPVAREPAPPSSPVAGTGESALGFDADPFARLASLGLRFEHESGRVPRAVWRGVRFDFIEEGDVEQFAEYRALFAEEFAKYPPDFVRASGLRAVAFVRELRYEEQPRWAVPDFVRETLYLDIGALRARGATFARRVIHHEYYHLLEEEWNGDAYFHDPVWAAFNEPAHRYGRGGATERDPAVALVNHPAPGFVSRYAMSGLEEDKAEVWAVMMTSELRRLVEPWRARDAILDMKIKYLEIFARMHDPVMDEDYWRSIRER